MQLQELIDLKARRETGVLIDRLKWAEILDWAIALTAHHEGQDKAEPVDDDEGWIMHTTGKQPVASDIKVDVFTKIENECGHTTMYKAASKWDWSIENVEGDILKYRLVK